MKPRVSIEWHENPDSEVHMINDRYVNPHREHDRREQRSASWREEGPDRYWGRRERFGSDRDYELYGEDRPRGTYDVRTESNFDRERWYGYDDDARMRGGTWSAGHGGATDHGYSGGLGSWQQPYQVEERNRYAGRGPKNYHRSDDRIFEDVAENLTEHPGVDATDIEVSVHHGEVKLEGTVETRDEKRLAEDCAWNVRGVLEVHNRLRVRAHDRVGERGGALRV